MTRCLGVATLVVALTATASASGLQGRSTSQKPPARRPAASAPAPAPASKPVDAGTGLKVTTAYTQRAQVSRNVTYLQGARQRVEFPGVVTIQQCDLGRTVLLNPSAKRYRVQPHAPVASPATGSGASDPMAGSLPGWPGAPTAAQAGGVVTVTTTLIDTLERQSLFGLDARRVKTTIIREADDHACDKSALKVEVDAWYVDLPAGAMCPVPESSSPAAGGCADRIEARTVGSVTLGFPVRSVTTTTAGEGDKADVQTVSHEVTALEITRLDPALFDVPSDYVEAVSSAEIVPAIAHGGSLADALFGSTADGTSDAAPKAAGTIRIGVLEPGNQTTRALSMTALRQELARRFDKAPFEAIPVRGSSAQAIVDDAARLECDYLLLADVTEAKTSRPGRLTGMMRRATGEAARDRHDVTVEYALYAVSAPETPVGRGSVKASSGGFGVGSALKVAAFAGQAYMSMYGMRGAGGMGLMNVASATASGGGPMGGFFDPRASAMQSAAFGLGGGAAGDPADQAMADTAGEAMGQAARAVTALLQKKQ